MTVHYAGEVSGKQRCHIQAPDKVFANVHPTKKQVCCLPLISSENWSASYLISCNVFCEISICSHYVFYHRIWCYWCSLFNMYIRF